MSEWLSMSAADLGRGIAAGEIGPVALTETYLAAIDAHPARDLIYSAVTHARARSEAQAAEARAKAGLRLGALDGVPISWKDLFDSAGTATEAGSRLLQGRVPERDAEVLRNATAAGLVCLGKTHMSELAFSGLGLNPMAATPPNVHDAGLVPGGSSSGAAASVAHGLAACGIGSDRHRRIGPDSVGVERSGGAENHLGPGVFERCGAALCEVRHGRAAVAQCGGLRADAGGFGGGQPADLDGVSVKGMRFAALQTVVLDDIREAPLAAYKSALERLSEAGAVIEKIDAPEVAEAMPLSGILFTSEAYGTWGKVIEASPEKMFAPILERFRSGKDFLAADYVAGWNLLYSLREQWAARVAGFDAVLMPSAPILPPNVERLMTDDDYYVTENLLALRNTRVGNLMGLCGVSLPTDVPACGLMLCGPAFGEEALLRVSKAVEDALG